MLQRAARSVLRATRRTESRADRRENGLRQLCLPKPSVPVQRKRERILAAIPANGRLDRPTRRRPAPGECENDPDCPQADRERTSPQQILVSVQNCSSPFFVSCGRRTIPQEAELAVSIGGNADADDLPKLALGLLGQIDVLADVLHSIAQHTSRSAVDG